MIEEWDGKDRRVCQFTSCPKIEAIEAIDDRVTKCKEKFEGELSRMHEAVEGLRNDVHGLRGDVHSMSNSIGSINKSLETIASTLTKLTDFPETWSKLKGFWEVMKWLRANITLLAVLLGAFGGALYLLAKASGVMG